MLSRVDGWLDRLYGSKYNPIYQTGAIAIALMALLLITGLYLLLFYRLGQPWESVARITEQRFAGQWIRGVHRFASDAAVVAIVLHALRMYAQRRNWGARSLAWISGVVLLFVVFICGWTGYVMVWDTPAQVIATEGARFLDALPIFSEPISRTFVGERTLPNAFFFLNLFAHVALPIGLGLFIWVHVSRVARPVLLPPRALLYTITAALLILSVVWPLRMEPKADLLRMAEAVNVDWFFVFWLPLTRRMSSSVVWMFGAGIGTGLLFLPLLTRPKKAKRPAKSVVNERHCTGCEQCMLDCPYGAIQMIARPDGREGIVARVNPDLCTACGICIGSCAPMALGPANQTGRDQLARAKAWLSQHPHGARDVVVIGCGWAGHEGTTFDVACAGNLHTSVIEYFIRSGAGGVLVASCPARDCRGREGPKWLNQRVYHDREAELKARVDRARVRIIEVSAGDHAHFRREHADFSASVAAMSRIDGEVDVDILALCEREEA